MNRMTSRIFAALSLLLFVTSVLGQNVVRGPYLQQQTDGSVIVRWRTDVATDSVVRYGLTPAPLSSMASIAGTRTEHSVPVTGLNVETQYYYSVGDSIGTIAGDATYHFHTAPVIGTPTATRFWAIGDSGTAVTHPGQAAAVRDAFKAYSASSPADFMMMLGDNAYNDGTDTQYQDAVFDTYPELLRQLPVWSTLGNHDGHSADSATQTGPYYDIFEPPTAGQIGGYPSGTEAYYSFDYGEVHFVCLDSYDSPRGVNGSMMTWLESDLAENNKPWVIAFWHHPPYSKGSHNSDSTGEVQMTDMRQNFLPVLEAWGVDLVLTGHSHSYERSFLLDGHYGLSSTLDLSDPSIHVLDWGDGSETGNGAYEKPGIIAAENDGAVYVVAGSSGKISGGALNHAAMFVGLNYLGSMVVDVVGNRLDAVFLDDNGLVRDEFTLLKTPDLSPPLIAGARAEDGTHVIVDFSERVDAASASLSTNYSIAGLSISGAVMMAGNKSVRLTTTPMTPGAGYTVTVNNVMDDEGNTILPNSQFAFDFIQQVTLSFQDGLLPTTDYDGTADSYIREATATTNYGAAVTLQVDGDEPSGTLTDMSIVIRWYPTYIPASATVDAVSIHFNTLNVGGPYSCFVLLRDWNQDEVTWNLASAGTAWGTPGAEAVTDRDSLPLCTFNAGSTGPIAIDLNSEGIALVQSWISDTADNNGIIITDAVSTNGADFDSSESLTAMSRPRLEITYTVPVIPPDLPPDAFYSFSCTDLDCSFTDLSVDGEGPIAGWSWDFGDGNTSVLQHPDHSYAAGGSYTVSLTVTDEGSLTDQYSGPVTVTPPNQPPTAAFTFICTSLDCSFTDTSTDSDGSITGWSWDFGDGNNSTAQNPNHNFAADGSYNVSLTATDNDGASDGVSNEVTVSQATVPDAPSGLGASTWSGAQINLSWLDNSDDEDGFKVERSPDGINSWIEIASLSAESTAHSDTGLNADTTWYYRVLAHNVIGDSGYSNVDSATTFTVPRTIQFSGRSWTVKSSTSPVGPGPNYFGDTSDDVWIDGSGYLHLKIVFRDGNWHSSEVIGDDVLGHGTYTFTLGSRVDLLDRNIVVGLFTWDTSAPEFNYREIDIEFSRWGDPLADNSQYVVQPWDTTGNTLRWDTVLTGNASTHAFEWRPDRVEFSSNQGSPPGAVIQSWTYNGPDVPPEGTTSGNARINFWLMGGAAPFDGQEAELVVQSFDFSPLPVNNPPSAGFTESCTDLDCDFTDTSSDSDGSIVSWVWDFGDSGSSTAQNPPHSYASDGSYTVELTVTDNEGATDVISRLVTVSEPPLTADVVANADISGAGTVSLSYTATHSDDGTEQSIRERESGGRKSNRYSYLIHTWQADLPANAMATVHVNAYSGGSSDDNFVFYWSTDNINYDELFIVSSTDPDNEQSALLPGVVIGPVYIRVEDSDQTPGNRSLDTVFVDHLYIRVESGAGDPPAAPSVLIATAAGSDQIDLVWTDNATDESGFKIERSLDNLNFSPLATRGADVTSYSDGGLTANTTYWYRVSAWNASGDSAWSNTDSATTDAPPPLPLAPSALTAVSSGSSSIDLSWVDNAGNEQGFEIERSTDNVIFESAGNTGTDITAFTDTGLAAGTTYWYRAYAYNASGNSAFSNTDSATTDAGPAISLTLNGYKIKGRHTIDLSWSGATTANVDIHRDGAFLETVSNTGAYTDATSNKGGRTYDYQLCEVGSANCSDIESVTF